MFNHILIPLDGSSLAECVIPHAIMLAGAFNAKVTLIHILEPPRDTGPLGPIDPLRWHLKRGEIDAYLERIAGQLRELGIPVTSAIEEGPAAERIINFAHKENADLIVLSTHGSSGLSKWNISSVVQKIILRANRSSLLVRAYETPSTLFSAFRYRHFFVGLDGSARAELVLPVAIHLARYCSAQLTFGTVARKPEIISHFPLSNEDEALLQSVIQRNEQVLSHYMSQLSAQWSQSGIAINTRIETSGNPIAALHGMVDNEGADMVMLVAHGRSGNGRWPYGSVSASFIAYGSTSLLIMQDLAPDEMATGEAEIATQQTQGH